MDPKALTDYELRRLETIRRNNQMLASLIPPSLKPQTPPSKRTKTTRPTPDSESEPEYAVRRSLRRRGLPPPYDPPPPCRLLSSSENPQPPRALLSIRESGSDLLSAMLTSDEVSGFDPGLEASDLDPRSELVLRSENVRKVGNGSILSMRFLPLRDRKVIVVGNRFGDLAFWDVDFSAYGKGVYLYRPHLNQVSGISVHPYSSRKIFTSSTDGSVRLMDIEKETFDLVLSSEHPFYSICQCPRDNNSLYLGEGVGVVKFWDEREGKASISWKLHGDRINTIDFNPENINLMATSSTDRLCCMWDLRTMKKESPENMKSFNHHQGAVHSAYFSPSGKYLATTSAVRGKVGIISGANFDDISMISQTNWTFNWPSPFRAIWGWDDSYIFVGNKNRAINVISTGEKTVTMLKSQYMTSIPCRFAVYNHPYMVGYLAGATTEGKVYLWTKEQNNFSANSQ